MAEKRPIVSARVDEIPLLLARQERMGSQSLLDEPFLTPGHWVGLSLGGVTVLWLIHILSEANHRLNHTEPRAAQRRHTPRGCTGQPVPPLDLGDDRLAWVLEALRDEARWTAFESTLTQHVLRMNELEPERVRRDSTTASGYWSVTEEGLFQFGHRQDQHPDLPRVKVMVSALDPLGLPVATDVVPGQRAEDSLDVPVLARVREGLGRRGRLDVGDCTMGALETRAVVQAGGDTSWCPVSELPVPPPVLATYPSPVWTGDQPLTPIDRGQTNGQQALIAEGIARLEPLTVVVTGAPVGWTERRLVIRSHQLAPAGERALRSRLAKAQAAMAALNDGRRGKRRVLERPALPAAVAAILARSHVQGLLQARYKTRVRQWAVRRYGDRPATVRVEQDWHVTASLDQGAVAAAERVLESFPELTLTIIREGRRRRSNFTPLSRVQQRILALPDLPVESYTRLGVDSRKPP